MEIMNDESAYQYWLETKDMINEDERRQRALNIYYYMIVDSEENLNHVDRIAKIKKIVTTNDWEYFRQKFNLRATWFYSLAERILHLYFHIEE